MSNNPERFPILTTFCLIFLAWQCGLAALYLWAEGVPTLPAVALCLARIFVVYFGLPETAAIPILISGKGYTAGQWLTAATTPAGASTLKASQWLLLYLPTVSFFLTCLSIFVTRQWVIKRGPKLVRGVRVIKR